MSKTKVRISFYVSREMSDWTGQLLAAWLPDGVVVKNVRSVQYPDMDRVEGWPRPCNARSLQLLKEAVLAMGGRGFRRFEQIQKKWDQQFKSRFPVQLIHPFIVIPSWKMKSPLKGRLPIYLKPAQAFGTGLHPTTRLILRQFPDLKPADKSMLDVGAGSGILGFAALRLGVRHVVCVEREETACVEMKGNLLLNGFQTSDFSIYQGPFEKVLPFRNKTHDLVICNMITVRILKHLPTLVRFRKKTGTLVLSGMYREEERIQVEKALLEFNLQPVVRKSLKQWWYLQI